MVNAHWLLPILGSRKKTNIQQQIGKEKQSLAKLKDTADTTYVGARKTRQTARKGKQGMTMQGYLSPLVP